MKGDPRMCGIMGYVGPQEAAPIVIDGLRRLEYRGYDSAGVAIHDGSALTVSKSEGKLARLVGLLDEHPLAGRSGIGHTRWATHGPPTDRNAHPHTDPGGEVVVVHNGIIENFLALKEELVAEGAPFTSETDTEVLAHLVAREYDGDLLEAVRRAVGRAEGAYALVAMARAEPGRIVAVRMISPLVVGIGDGEMFLASDVPAILHHTRDIVVVDNGEMVDLTAEGWAIQRLDGTPVHRERLEITWDAQQAERGGYEHFMLKEIFEQPQAVTDTLSGRLLDDGAVALEDVDLPPGLVEGLDRIWITACGTALHAGHVGKELFERILRIPTEAAYAHELRYSDPIIGPGSLTIAISQSGETADTLAAATLAKERGSRLLALTNVVGSTLSREADDILYTRAGPEIAVASTKAYMTMLAGEYLLALDLGRARGTLAPAVEEQIVSALRSIPARLAEVLDTEKEVAAVAPASRVTSTPTS
jgi:glutamine---fructose-6-phosphate transaminase (isomerizing)